MTEDEARRLSRSLAAADGPFAEVAELLWAELASISPPDPAADSRWRFENGDMFLGHPSLEEGWSLAFSREDHHPGGHAVQLGITWLWRDAPSASEQTVEVAAASDSALRRFRDEVTATEAYRAAMGLGAPDLLIADGGRA